jgi:ferritin
MESLLKPQEIEVLNRFGKLELNASQAYLNLAALMQMKGAFGAEAFFRKESDSEREHFDKIRGFMNSLNVKITIPALEAQECDCTTIKEALETAYEMEVNLLKEYEKEAENVNLSLKVVLLLQDFTTHQVEAVGEFSDLIAIANLTNDELLLDNKLKKM